MKKHLKTMLLVLISTFSLIIVGCSNSEGKLEKELGLQAILDDIDSGSKTRTEAIEQVEKYFNEKMNKFTTTEEKNAFYNDTLESRVKIHSDIDDKFTEDEISEEFFVHFQKNKEEGKPFYNESDYRSNKARLFLAKINKTITSYNESINDFNRALQSIEENSGIVSKVFFEYLIDSGIDRNALGYIKRKYETTCQEDYRREILKDGIKRIPVENAQEAYEKIKSGNAVGNLESYVQSLDDVLKISEIIESPYEETAYNEIITLKTQLENSLKENEQLWAEYRKEKEEKEKKEEEEKKTELASKGVSIGMTQEQVKSSSWGEPKKINTTQSKYGVSEQWVYEGGNYLYFDDGILTTIQTSN